ncbi:MAG: hypothetical protein ABJC79_14180 [Acidimicrobiia bacterium]
MRLPSPRAHRLFATTCVAGGLLTGLATMMPAGVAGAANTDAGTSVNIVVDANVATTVGITVTCETPRVPTADDIDIAGAAMAERRTLSVPGQGGIRFQIADLTDGSACNVTASGPEAAHLDAVDGGVPLVGSDGQVRGVAVTVDRGTLVTAHLTFQIPVVIPATVPRTEATDVRHATGSGSAASPPLLPGSDGEASAAAPVALAAARSTTTESSAALPDPSGTGTVFAMACIGILLCGAVAYAMVLSSRRTPTPR